MSSTSCLSSMQASANTQDGARRVFVCMSRMVTQVALLGKVPEPFDSVAGLVQWQEAHRRKLLQSKSWSFCPRPLCMRLSVLPSCTAWVHLCRLILDCGCCIAYRIAVLTEVCNATAFCGFACNLDKSNDLGSSVTHLGFSASAGLPASNSLTNAQWSERATAVTSFLVLLAGAFGGVQCLTHMNFKRDTLLFGSAKSD